MNLKSKERFFMKSKKLVTALTAICVSSFILFSCTEKVSSKPNFIFKPAPSKGVAAKIGSKTLTEGSVFKDIQAELYEAEMKVYEIKMNKLKAIIVENLMEMDPKKKGMTNDAYLEKYVTSTVKVSEKQIQAFIKQRKIPKQHINEQMNQRIRQFLEVDLKKKAIDTWIAKKTQKNPVEIYMKKPMRPVFNVQAGDAPFVGGADAKVTVVEFSDFQCPFCAKGANVVTELKKKYGNKIKIAFKNFPLPFHNHADMAAQAGLCAHEQKSQYFWKMHDRMFGDQTKLTKEGLVASAKALGLKVDQFTKCIDSKKYAAKVKSDIEEGKKVGVKSTPTFFVNGQLINGAHPVEVFSEIIDEALEK
jgi:protein-disulfide isomerase